MPQGLKRVCENSKKKPQISPLRYAPVEMTNLWLGDAPFSMEKTIPTS
jgi:hypothetical protein